MKAAFMEEENQQKALNQFLAAYRAIPRIANGVPPGDFLLRDGYRVDFPTRKPLKTKDIVQAKQNDVEKKEGIQTKANLSVKRRKEQISIGDTVLLKNQKRAKKFDPKFDPRPCQVKDVSERGLTLFKQSDNAIFFRHKDDTKPFVGSPVNNSHCWYHAPRTASIVSQEKDNVECSETPQNNANSSEITTLPTANSDEATTVNSELTRTRSGRLSKPPSWFRDYEL